MKLGRNTPPLRNWEEVREVLFGYIGREVYRSAERRVEVRAH